MKIRHILKAKDFADIVKSGERARGRTLALYVKHGSGEEKTSVGVVVSKEFAPSAVKRNYIKRLVYSYFQDREQPLSQGIRVVVRLIRDVKELRRKPLSQGIRGELEALAKKIGIKA